MIYDSKFNKDNYNSDKIEIINLIKKSLKQNEGFLMDGIHDPESFEKEELKILFVASENYGYGSESDVYDIAGQSYKSNVLIKDIKKGTKNRSAKLAWLLLKSLDEKRQLFFKDFQMVLIILKN